VDLNNLQKFINTVKAGSITAAARDMQMPKSSLSRQLRQLENQLNIKLLERRPRNLEVTEAGQQLFEQTEPLLAGIQEAHEDLESMRLKPRGPLHIQVPTESLGEDISEICLAFMQDYPDIKICITQYTAALPSHPEKQDISFVLHDTPLPDMDVVARTLASFPQSIYSSISHPEICSLRDIEQQKQVLRSDEDFWHFRSTKNQRLSIKTNPSIIMDSHEMRVQACLRGYGLARFTDYSVESHVKNKLLKRTKLDDPMTAVLLSVLYRQRRVPKKAGLFVDFVQSHIGKMTARK
jgi:DNA-binding transcriptional LysR family regulator